MILPDDPTAKIKNIKEGIVKRHALQKKREELEHFLSEEKIKAQNTLLKAHQSNTEQLFGKAKEHEYLCQELLHKLRQIDKELDKVEEYDENEINDLKTSLINDLLKANPEHQPIIDALIAKRKKWEETGHYNERLLAMFANLKHLMTTIRMTRLRIKRLSIFSYILGASPNLMIGQCLQGIIKIIQEEKKTVSHLQNLFPNKNFLELSKYLLDLEEESNRRWSYRSLDNFTAKNVLKIDNFNARFEELEIQVSQELTRADDELQTWIDVKPIIKNSDNNTV